MTVASSNESVWAGSVVPKELLSRRMLYAVAPATLFHVRCTTGLLFELHVSDAARIGAGGGLTQAIDCALKGDESELPAALIARTQYVFDCPDATAVSS